MSFSNHNARLRFSCRHRGLTDPGRIDARSEVPLVARGRCLAGEVAGVDHAATAVPFGLAFKVQLAGRFRRLDATPADLGSTKQ